MSYYNMKMKLYDNSNYSVTICNRHIFNDTKNKKKLKKDNSKNKINCSKKKKKNELNEKSVLRSVKRAKERIFDIVYLNDFDYFITLTFNPNLINSFDKKEVMHVVMQYFYYLKHCNPDMKYLLVPELHKSNRIHIHVLVSNCDLKLVNSTKKNVYNISSWKFGFSTAKKITKKQVKLAHYVSKYITKDIKRIFGKYYWSSHNLERDVPVYFFNVDYNDVDEQEYIVPATDIKLKYSSYFNYDTKK